ncbi:MAG TPA: glycogen debranching N-terminal domain-containing protein, partial [Vicinamibacterales bacterium]|nr:glycogen debranching N-terminal domain-containing protein [Vicinamibacterales bacterium]
TGPSDSTDVHENWPVWLEMRRSGESIDPHHSLQLTFHGYTVLVTDADGSIGGGTMGLFDYDTRILSRYRLLVDDEAPRCDTSAAVASDYWAAHLTVPRPGRDPHGPRLPQDALAIEVRRRVGRGMVEQLIVRNFSMAAADVTLQLELDADFTDVLAPEGAPSYERTTRRLWDGRTGTLTFDHCAEANGRRLHRATRIRVVHSDSSPADRGDAIVFTVSLAAQASWTATMLYESLVDDSWRAPHIDDVARESACDRLRKDWRRQRAQVDSPHPVFASAYENAAEDLFSLRAWELDSAPDAWMPNAGVPTYTGIFGRDSLTTACQGALVGPEMLRGSLAHIADAQAHDDSAWHDREPGKMVHEMRRGPLSELEIIPQRAYYGTQTTSAMFVVALSEYWHWTGDTAALQHYRDSALRALEWARRYGDRDGDGFLEYERRSPRGLKNHGWKDSDEAIRYPDGRLVENPIATIEEQAFYWLALQRMAEILVALGEDSRAEEFAARAQQLRERWHCAFWMPDEHFYAIALDADKQPVRSIASNPGHALGAGLVPIAHARACADRLMAADMFSGWGIRTLSCDHPSYNPLAYHLGTVWPVENATFALGFKRYGLDEHLDQLAAGLFEAVAHFRNSRLPEALGGHGRQETPIPTAYPRSNSPQAWSASAMVQLVQTLLGIYPFAPAHVVALVRPYLPEWLPAVTVRNVRVGNATASIRFERGRDGATAFDVFDKRGPLFVVEMPPPQDTEASSRSWDEGVRSWLLERAPGRFASALRLALGIADS